jgi:hypothetical protein
LETSSIKTNAHDYEQLQEIYLDQISRTPSVRRPGPRIARLVRPLTARLQMPGPTSEGRSVATLTGGQTHPERISARVTNCAPTLTWPVQVVAKSEICVWAYRTPRPVSTFVRDRELAVTWCITRG